jgi:hypothetical protein
LVFAILLLHFLFRQVTKNDVDALLTRYSSVNLTHNCSKEEKQPNLFLDASSNIKLFHITHLECTVCEEYQLIENIFHEILRDIKKDRISLEVYSNNQDDILQSLNSGSKTKLKPTNSKRAKSPKSNPNSLIHQNTNILSDDMNNNISSDGLFSIDSSYNSNLKKTNLSAINARSRNSSPSFSNGDFNNINTTSKDTTPNSVTSSGLIKKNSSKFPFFNKILNKSS